MILTCPACGTQYVVKDGAIPPGGRQVRCASCRHSWHQDPNQTEETVLEDENADARAENEAQPADIVDERPEEHAIPVTTAADDADEIPASEEMDAPDKPLDRYELERQPTAPLAVEGDDDFTPFASGDVDEPKRRSPAFGILMAVLLVVVAALAFWYFAPAEWKARVGLAEAAETPLQLMMTHSDRQRLASGNELLAISGRVINPTQEQQNIPPITAQLRDDKGKLVYSWTIAPPAPSLKAGDSAPFYSAEVNVPAGGNELTVTLGAPKA